MLTKQHSHEADSYSWGLLLVWVTETWQWEIGGKNPARKPIKNPTSDDSMWKRARHCYLSRNHACTKAEEIIGCPSKLSCWVNQTEPGPTAWFWGERESGERISRSEPGGPGLQENCAMTQNQRSPKLWRKMEHVRVLRRHQGDDKRSGTWNVLQRQVEWSALYVQGK